MKDVDDAKFKLKLQSMNLDVSGLEKELINHDSYLESLKDIISNLDSTIINNSSSALSTSSINVGNNFKKKKKKIINISHLTLIIIKTTLDMLIIHNILIMMIKIINNCCVQNVVIKSMRLNFVGLIYYVGIVIKRAIQKDGV